MHLIQILLPLYGGDNHPLPRDLFDRTRAELVEHFGGLTAYARAPATGIWKPGNEEPVRDQIVIYEIMVDKLDVVWWTKYRAQLEQRFAQDQLVIRALPTEVL